MAGIYGDMLMDAEEESKFLKEHIFLASQRPVPDTLIEVNLVRHLLRGHTFSTVSPSDTREGKWLISCHQDADDHQGHVVTDGRTAGAGGKDGQHRADPGAATLHLTRRPPYTFWLRPAGFGGQTQITYVSLARQSSTASSSSLKNSIGKYLTVQYFPRGNTGTNGYHPTQDESNINVLAAEGCYALDRRMELRAIANAMRPQDADTSVVSKPKTKGHGDIFHFFVLVSADDYSVWSIGENHACSYGGVTPRPDGAAPMDATNTKAMMFASAKSQTDHLVEEEAFDTSRTHSRSTERQATSTRRYSAKSSSRNRSATELNCQSTSDTPGKTRAFERPTRHLPTSPTASGISNNVGIGGVNNMAKGLCAPQKQGKMQAKYRAQLLAVGNACDRDSMKCLVDWFTAIHVWASRIHALSMQKDLDDYQEGSRKSP